MPIALTNGPGVYVQELPNPVHPIVGVPTSVAAFCGPAPEGAVDDPFQVNSWADYENEFGGLDSAYPLSYAVFLFFLNGGSTALVVRFHDANDKKFSAQLSKGQNPIVLNASSPGDWGQELSYQVDTGNLFGGDNQFNLTITRTSNNTTVAQEVYAGANLKKGTSQYLPTLLAGSRLVTPVNPGNWKDQPDNTVDKNGNPQPVPFNAAATTASTPGGGQQTGEAPTGAQPNGAPASTAGAVPPFGDLGQKTGMYALLKADIFNILCLPVDPAHTYGDLSEPAEFCVQQRAMLIIDPPKEWKTIPLQFSDIHKNPALGSPSPNAAVYYPNLVLTDDTAATFNAGPCGAVAGVWAATDNSRGVWKAPAGTAAAITGITGFTAQVNDGESGLINPLAVNGLRTMPLVGHVVWGARTTVGADQVPDQWKYLPVRRLALFIEESLRRGTQWTVFEPNDEPLWSSLRLNVTTFMQGLFRQGAFAGTTPAHAYLVQCDANNNPPDQVALGIVNILVGFAPLYPAEFVIFSIQQQAGQA
ncbi:MAG: phage tail sheath C-terminal domain-containing protein [Streptosporangiaceae bacterium]